MFLIARHLDLSAAMQSRDLFDPQTVRDVAHQVGTVERLKAAHAADLRRYQRGQSQRP